ncbi:hypothetical protein, partial [Staphylococcus aureus]
TNSVSNPIYLDFSYNLLAGACTVGAVGLRANLGTFKASHNQITALPFDLYAAPALTYIDFSYNAITGYSPLPDPSVPSVYVTYIDYSGNPG